MTRKAASIFPLNQAAIDKNWRALIADTLSEKGVRGATITVFYRNGDYRTGWSGIKQSDLALAGARLSRLAIEDRD